MSFIDLAKSRRSIRSFLPKEVSDKDIELLLEAANWAPSAGNLQSRAIIVVRDLKKKTLLSSAAMGQPFVAEAPVVFIFCINQERAKRYGERGIGLYCIQDASAAVQNLLLAASDIGLGACWVGAFDEQQVSSLLSLPENIKPVALVPVGHAKDSPTAPRRKEDIHWDAW